MPSINSVLKQLRTDYPQFTFKSAPVSRWSPHDKTIYFSLRPQESIATLFHELGHAINDHKTYRQDIELLRCEREAWQTARQIAPCYGVNISEEEARSAILTYREWLYRRSLCPICKLNAIHHIKYDSYHCLICNSRWQANDARQCGLKRYLIPNKNTRP